MTNGEELWGCGFNQFNQIDDSEEDIFTPKLIQSLPSTADDVEILWCGWADLLCTTPHFIDLDSYRDPDNRITLVYRGNSASEEFRESLNRFGASLFVGDKLSAFGSEVLKGVIKHSPTRTSNGSLFEDDGSMIPIKGIQEIAISGSGYVGVILEGNRFISTNPDWTTLHVYRTLSEFHSNSSKPLVTISIPSAGTQVDSVKPITSLSAGDAHFSFIITHWPSSHDIETFYSNLWSIRTDPRSLNDSEWIPVQDELSSLEDESFVQINASDDVRVLSAHDNQNAEFAKSAGWITVAKCDEGEAWIYPFGRAKMMVPDLEAGRTGFDSITDVGVGSEHVVLLDDDGVVWTVGNNNHGQRGFENIPSQRREKNGPWRVINSFPPNTKIKKIACGKWNTFFIVERHQP
jgi:hypothetical protein